MQIAFLIIVAVVSFAVCMLASHWQKALDQPGARSLHDKPIPRTGGFVIQGVLLAAVLAGYFAGVSISTGWPLLAAWILVLSISTVDDFGHVRASVRITFHIAAAGIIVWHAGFHPVLEFLLLVLLLGWMTNLYNFMDGMDGLAASMSVVGGCGLAGLAWIGGDPHLALFAAAIAAASAGFLAVNFPPASLFMGDTGSIGTGFLLGSISIIGYTRGLYEWPVPLLLFMPFIADASLTLALRASRRERVWEAHRDHIYQRLVLKGWSVRQVLGLEWLIMLVCGGLAIQASLMPQLAFPLLGAAVVAATILYVVARRMT